MQVCGATACAHGGARLTHRLRILTWRNFILRLQNTGPPWNRIQRLSCGKVWAASSTLRDVSLGTSQCAECVNISCSLTADLARNGLRLSRYTRTHASIMPIGDGSLPRPTAHKSATGMPVSIERLARCLQWPRRHSTRTTLSEMFTSSFSPPVEQRRSIQSESLAC